MAQHLHLQRNEGIQGIASMACRDTLSDLSQARQRQRHLMATSSMVAAALGLRSPAGTCVRPLTTSDRTMSRACWLSGASLLHTIDVAVALMMRSSSAPPCVLHIAQSVAARIRSEKPHHRDIHSREVNPLPLLSDPCPGMSCSEHASLKRGVRGCKKKCPTPAAG